MIRIFFDVRTLRGTVSHLNAEGKLLPTRYRGRRLEWKKATIDMVRRILLLRAYAGFYVYGLTEHRPEFGVCPNGLPRRKSVPEDRWVTIPNHHPAYMTAEQQERIKLILQDNAFTRRTRPGSGDALCQGLIRCARCGGMMCVGYAKPNHGPHRYQCTVLATKYGEKPCGSVQGAELDAAVVRAVLAVLRTPPLDVLREALAAAREADRTHAARIDADRQRLAYQVERARERYEKADPRNERVLAFASEQFEKCMREQSDFERSLALQQPRRATDGTEEALHELCALASDIPSLWDHPAVRSRERKEILHCVIDAVTVSTTPLSIEMTLLWASGAQTALRLWRRAGVDELIRQRHADGMTAYEIRNWLAYGDTTTGQRWERTTAAVYQALRRLGLRPNPARQTMALHRARVRELHDDGKTLGEIASILNASGSRTPHGSPWKINSVYRALGLELGADRYAELHGELIADAKCRGLTAKQTADEFNAKRVPRYSAQPWTADAVRQRGCVLRRADRRLERQNAQVTDEKR